jgi:hypothetical protein
MMAIRKKFIAGVCACASVLASNVAKSDIYTFELTWSGQWAYGPEGPFGNNDAKASAIIVMEAPASDPNVTMERITSVSMTVQDAVIGNGTFTKADFSNIYTSYRQVPELAINERYWLSGYDLYDFVVFSNGTGAPTQFANYMLWAGGIQDSNVLYMNSMYVTRTLASAVPEPESYALLLGGLAMVGALSRRRARTSLI